MSGDRSECSGCSIIPSLRRIYAGMRTVLSQPCFEVGRLRCLRVSGMVLANGFCRGHHVRSFEPHVFYITIAKPFDEVFPSASIPCWSGVENLFNFIRIASLVSFLSDYWRGLCVTRPMLRRFDVWCEERGVEDGMDACILPCLRNAQLVRDRP
jgi:hypothetical protein